MKPLFIPLRREWFEQFLSGAKTTEFRRYGAKWNERTCVPGRNVTLSLGYGKHHRIHAEVLAFERRDDIETPIYPKGTVIAVVHLRLHPTSV